MQINTNVELHYNENRIEKLKNCESLISFLIEIYDPKSLKEILEQIIFAYSQSIITMLSGQEHFSSNEGEKFNGHLYVLNELKNAIGIIETTQV